MRGDAEPGRMRGKRREGVTKGGEWAYYGGEDKYIGTITGSRKVEEEEGRSVLPR